MLEMEIMENMVNGMTGLTGMENVLMGAAAMIIPEVAVTQ